MDEQIKYRIQYPDSTREECQQFLQEIQKVQRPQEHGHTPPSNKKPELENDHVKLIVKYLYCHSPL
jgi:hypothetical protein